MMVRARQRQTNEHPTYVQLRIGSNYATSDLYFSVASLAGLSKASHFQITKRLCPKQVR
jgi:hypothetical protein